MIVIDTNTFSSVFNSQSADHNEFKPVIQWIKTGGDTCIVYGGTKYRIELKKAVQYLKLFNEFKKIGKVVEIDIQLVDEYEKMLEDKNKEKAFNDKHIVAIINTSGCRLVCTKDSASMSYLKNHDFYIDSKVPKIYSGLKNRDLLNRTNIVSLKNVVK